MEDLSTQSIPAEVTDPLMPEDEPLPEIEPEALIEAEPMPMMDMDMGAPDDF